MEQIKVAKTHIDGANSAAAASAATASAVTASAPTASAPTASAPTAAAERTNSDATLYHIHPTTSQRIQFDFKQHVLKTFTPVYFVTIMGTGISSTILYNFPYPGIWLRYCSYIMWAVAILLFLMTNILFGLSLYYYPKKIRQVMFDPSISVFLGCYPMGYTTLVNMSYLVSKDRWIIGIYVLWWICVFLSLFTAWITTFCLITKSDIKSETLHATLLLPVVPLTVAASSGGLFVLDLPTRNLQVVTMVICYILWCNAIACAFSIITIYMWKLFVHKIPPKMMVFTSFLPVGVLGQGAYGILLLGHNTHEYILQGSPDAVIEAKIFLYFGLLMSLFLISFGFFFTFLAVMSCITHGLTKYHKGWWAMTFPLGTMSLSTTEVYRLFDLKAFRVIGAMYGTTLIVITVCCIVGTFTIEYGADLYKELHPIKKCQTDDRAAA